MQRFHTGMSFWIAGIISYLYVVTDKDSVSQHHLLFIGLGEFISAAGFKLYKDNNSLGKENNHKLNICFSYKGMGNTSHSLDITIV